MVRIPGFHCCGLGSVPGWGTEMLQAAWCGQKNKYKQTNKFKVLIFSSRLTYPVALWTPPLNYPTGTCCTVTSQHTHVPTYTHPHGLTYTHAHAHSLLLLPFCSLSWQVQLPPIQLPKAKPSESSLILLFSALN